MIMESLACGTPVVAFDIGGNPDMITHKKNGYLANPFEPAELARGIDWILNNPASHKLSDEAVKGVEKSFSMKKIAYEYVDLYKKVCDEHYYKKS